MTVKNLLKFCNPDSMIAAAREPFRGEPGMCYATNGKIAIRVREDVPDVLGDFPYAKHYASKIDDFIAVGPTGSKKSGAKAYTLDGAAVARFVSATTESLRSSHANALRDCYSWQPCEIRNGLLSLSVKRSALVLFNGVPFSAHYVSIALRAFLASCRLTDVSCGDVPALVVYVCRKSPCIWFSWPSVDVVLLGISFPGYEPRSYYIKRDGLTAVAFTAKPDSKESTK